MSWYPFWVIGARGGVVSVFGVEFCDDCVLVGVKCFLDFVCGFDAAVRGVDADLGFAERVGRWWGFGVGLEDVVFVGSDAFLLEVGGAG